MTQNQMMESETREYKKGLTELKEGIISLVAILNKHGAGELWFGIKPDGKPVGVDVGSKTMRDLSQAIAAHVEPKVYPAIKLKTVGDCQCIQVSFSGKESPYFAYGRAYVRVADEDRQMSAKELERFILAKNRDAARYDMHPGSLRLCDLDARRVERFTRQANLPWDVAARGIQDILEKLGLLVNRKLLQAAGLFFARKPPARLRCAIFAGRGDATIVDQHDFEGDILELIQEAQHYLLKNIHIGMRMNGLRREDVPEIDPDALREAIVNAFCHRDWYDPESVRVAVFPDRVEIRNPGGLPEGLTVERMRKGHLSCRRNPLVAELLRRVHLVEAWGHGVPLMLARAPFVEFEDVAGVFTARFHRPACGSGKSSGKSSGKTEERILSLIARDAQIAIPALAARLNLSSRAIEKQIAKLQKAGRLRRVGPDKGGHWEMLD
jgi:ATP-dependent DNA helicase RecG